MQERHACTHCFKRPHERCAFQTLKQADNSYIKKELPFLFPFVVDLLDFVIIWSFKGLHG